MALKKGDRVTIRSDLKAGKMYGCFRTNSEGLMNQYFGKTTKILDTYSGSSYKLEIDDGRWVWDREMIHPCKQKYIAGDKVRIIPNISTVKSHMKGLGGKECTIRSYSPKDNVYQLEEEGWSWLEEWLEDSELKPGDKVRISEDISVGIKSDGRVANIIPEMMVYRGMETTISISYGKGDHYNLSKTGGFHWPSKALILLSRKEDIQSAQNPNVFKIGDKVKILDTPNIRGWTRGSECIGKVGMITHIQDTIYFIDDNKYSINFIASDLERLVDEKDSLDKFSKEEFYYQKERETKIIKSSKEQKGKVKMQSPKNLNNTDKITYSKLTPEQKIAWRNEMIHLDGTINSYGDEMILHIMPMEEKLKYLKEAADTLDSVNKEDK